MSFEFDLNSKFPLAEKALDSILLLIATENDNLRTTIIPLGLNGILLWLKENDCTSPLEFINKAGPIIGFDRAQTFADKVTQALAIVHDPDSVAGVLNMPLNSDGSVPDDETIRQALVDKGLITQENKYEVEIAGTIIDKKGVKPMPKAISRCHPEFGNLLDPDEVEKELYGE